MAKVLIFSNRTEDPTVAFSEYHLTREDIMTRTSVTLGAALLMLAGASAASAATTPAVDAGPVQQNSQAMAAADQMPTSSIREQLQDQLTKAGSRTSR